VSGQPRALTEAWQAQAEWSARASALKARIARRRSIVLWLVAGTAVFGGLGTVLTTAAAPAMTTARLVSAIAAVLAAVAGTIQFLASRENTVEQWNRARAVAEALKEAVYRYRTGTGTYAGDDRDAALRRQVDDVVERGRDLLAMTVTGAAPTREPPPALDAAGYVEHRLSQQIDGYYLSHVAELSASRARWQRAEQGLLYSGAVIGALTASLPQVPLAPWVAVVTTIAGAVAAHVEGARFSHLIVSYRATADRLSSLRSRFLDDDARGSPIDFDALVDRAEDAISVENQAWMAGWSGRQP
jgi:SMODS and SLOG-associating 2TM effector domain 1/Protein of unknown function (DUF4231)